MNSPALRPSNSISQRRFGLAWLLFVAALALHVTDEALTGFLTVYNPTVLEIRQRVPWLRPPTFGYTEWLSGLVIGISALLLLTPLAYAAPRAMRIFAMPLGVLVGILNGCGHLTGTIAGRTFADIHFPCPMPGTYSSPFLIAAAVNLVFASHRAKTRNGLHRL
jgi:hypothetical protein